MESKAIQSDVALAEGIARGVAERGGRAYYVGGFVRDAVLGRSSKDVDIEVHGLGEQELRNVLLGFGEVNAMGASFGILGIRGHALDIAMPCSMGGTCRDERWPQDVEGDLRASVEHAARRRDLTMNALYRDVLTGEVIDCFGGCADMERGVIRHVDDKTFAEDPLRVLRVAQFAARFGMEVDGSTAALCARLDLGGLAPERVLEEVRKALVKSSKPSTFFDVLRAMDQLDPWLVEVGALVGVPQNPKYHPEGDVFAHTMLVVDRAAEFAEASEDRFSFMLAALCHDFGKAVTTRELKGRIVSYGHETAGVPLARELLGRLGSAGKVRAYVSNMVELHMAPNAYVAQHAKQKAYNRLFDRSVCPRDLLLLARADSLGRGGDLGRDEGGDELVRRLEAFEDVMSRPYVQGRDLLDAGMQPGPLMGEVLQHAHKLRLAGMAKEDQLRQCIGYWHGLERERGIEKA